MWVFITIVSDVWLVHRFQWKLNKEDEKYLTVEPSSGVVQANESVVSTLICFVVCHRDHRDIVCVFVDKDHCDIVCVY